MDRMWLGLALAGVMAFGSRERPTMADRQGSRTAQDSAAPAEALPRALERAPRPEVRESPA